MDIEKLKAEFEQLEYIKEKLEYLNFDEHLGCYIEKNNGMPVGLAAWVNGAFYGFEQAKAQAVPEGFVLVKKRNMIGNPNVDWLQAPKWAKYWLKDGHSNKYWWSSIRPVKDMDINAFCWKGDYFAKEAPDFSYSGPWDKSLTSRKAMIEAQEQSR